MNKSEKVNKINNKLVKINITQKIIYVIDIFASITLGVSMLFKDEISIIAIKAIGIYFILTAIITATKLKK